MAECSRHPCAMQPVVAHQYCGLRRPLKAEVSAAALHRPQVKQWVDRELQALLLDSDVSVVAQHIQGSISAAFPQATQRCDLQLYLTSLAASPHQVFALMQRAEALLGLSCPLGPDASVSCCATVRSQLPTCCLLCITVIQHSWVSGQGWLQILPFCTINVGCANICGESLSVAVSRQSVSVISYCSHRQSPGT